VRSELDGTPSREWKMCGRVDTEHTETSRTQGVLMERQFVVQFDNRPGELAHLARALGARGINITHISCAGMGKIACAFMTTEMEGQTRDVLRGLGYEYLEGATVVVDVMDRPGGLADVAERFAAAGVNILGTLCVGRREGVLEMAFAVDDATKARAALTQAELAGVG
jgi:hypothetical protein